MNKIWQTLFEPQYRSWRFNLPIFFGLYYFLFFYFFHPFRDDRYVENYVITTYSYLGLALCIFIGSGVCLIVIPHYFPKYFLPKNFTFGKFCLLASFCFVFSAVLSYFNHYYFFIRNGVYISGNDYLFVRVIPLLLFTTVPLLIFTFLIFYVVIALKNEGRSLETQLENKALGKPPQYEEPSQYEETPQYEENNKSEIFQFSDTGNKKTFYIPSNKLYYITSAQNYIEVHYEKEDGSRSRILLRNTLKAIEEDFNLNMNSSLIRCHKAFIVNREKVVEMNGTTKVAHFILKNIEDAIPISRQKYPELEGQFKFLSKRELKDIYL